MTRKILMLVGALSSLASAQTYTWTGAAGQTWSNPANWSGGVAPVSSTTSTIVFPDSIAGQGSNYTSFNDLAGLNVGTVQLTGGQLNGNVVRVHQRVDGSSQSVGFFSQLPLEIASNVQLVSPTPKPTPAVSPAIVSYVGTLDGSGSATFEGGWRVDRFDFNGDVTVTPTGSLMAYASGKNVQSFRGDGLIDLQGSIASAQPVDLSRGVLEIGRNDLTIGAPVAGRLAITGDLVLGGWQIGGIGQGERLADRVDVSGLLDLTQSHVLPTSSLDIALFPLATAPAYVVLASYGNRVGSFDVSSILVQSSFQPNLSGIFPIIYTSGENAGPGEIRVLLPEPSGILMAAFGLMLSRQRRSKHP